AKQPQTTFLGFVLLAIPSARKHRVFLTRLFSVIAFLASVSYGAYELGKTLYEIKERRSLADDYALVGKKIYEDENNPTVALAFIKKALKLRENHPDYLITQAYIEGMAAIRNLLNLDRPYNAKELNETHFALAKAILLEKQNPEATEPHLLRGQIYFALKDYKRSVASLETALRLDPKNYFAHVRMALALQRSGDEIGAGYNLAQALKLNPQSKWAHLWLGIFAKEGQRLDEAERHFDAALDIDQRFDLAYYNKAWAYLEKKPRNYEQATEMFRTALRLNPDYKEAYYGLGMVYGYQNKYQIAHQYLSKAIKLDATFLTGQKWRGIVNDERGKFEEALSDYTRAIQLDPANSELYVRRARVFTKQEKYDDALQDLLRAKDLDPKIARIDFYKGNIYQKLQLQGQAIASYTAALVLKPLYPEAFVARALSYELRGQLDNARRDFEDAINLAKYRPERILRARADFHLRHGDYASAKNDFKAARRANPRDFKSWWGEAEALSKLGDTIQALSAVNEYQKLRPKKEDKVLILKQVLQVKVRDIRGL
ncbi:MAG: tetratricopeptide repeat protein, partial [Alphaproteobacteria bacterium]|nr:tetratricopeptide repeat protein [Alphaproteobacteria bacterium]